VVAAFIIALGSTALIFASAGHAAAQAADDCDVGTCEPSGVTWSDSGSADVTNDSGAVLVHEDGGSPTVHNGSGAVNVEADGGSPSVDNNSGAVVVEANGGSPSVSNDSGAVLVESEAPALTTPSTRTVFVPVPVAQQRVVTVPLRRLPATGGAVTEVVEMALMMIGFGTALLFTKRIAGGDRGRVSGLVWEFSPVG
jgi:hypothetical protein